MFGDESSLESLVDALAAVIPLERVSIDDADRLSHGRDEWPRLAADVPQSHGSPLAVVRPATVGEVQATMAVARDLGVSLIPYGAGSGVVGAVVPRRPSISLDMTAMSGVTAFSESDRVVTVRSGTIAMELEEYLNDRGFTFPHYPQSLPLATLGGLVATRSSGIFSSKYGNIEDRLIAAEVVLANGSVVRSKLGPRSSTGPRSIDLLVGSEGTLGVITEVTLAVVKMPEARLFSASVFDSFSGGLNAIHAILDRSITPALVRLYEPSEAAHVAEFASVDISGRSLLMLGFDGDAQVAAAELEAAMDEVAKAGGMDLGSAITSSWFNNRFDASWLDRGNAGPSRMADAIEVSSLWSTMMDLYNSVIGRLADHADTVWAHISHVYGSGASIYFIVFLEDDDPERLLERYDACWDSAMEATLAASGSISHHHGVGEARASWIDRERGSEIQVLRSIKQALDPFNILNPGKLADHCDGSGHHAEDGSDQDIRVHPR